MGVCVYGCVVAWIYVCISVSVWVCGLHSLNRCFKNYRKYRVFRKFGNFRKFIKITTFRKFSNVMEFRNYSKKRNTQSEVCIYYVKLPCLLSLFDFHNLHPCIAISCNCTSIHT